MIALTIIAVVCFVVIVGGLSWLATQNQNIGCNSNGCTGDCSQGDYCTCATTAPEINPNWPFPDNKS